MTTPVDLTRSERTLTAENLDEVLHWLPALERPQEPLYTLVEGGLDPYVYSDTVLGILRSLRKVGLTSTADSMQWAAQADAFQQEPARLATADLPTAGRLLTCLVRRERFESGHLAQLLNSGYLVALLRRVRVLRDELVAAAARPQPVTDRIDRIDRTPRRAALLYRDAQGQDRSVDLLPAGASFLGRHSDCIVRTEDARVLRRNTRIVHSEGRWFVEDMTSADGTFLNERKVERAALTHGDDGDVIRCGALQVRFVERPEQPGCAVGEGEPAPWIPALKLQLAARAGDDELTSRRWHQSAGGPEPLLAKTVAELAARVSLEDTEGCYALHLLEDPSPAACARVLEFGGWSQRRQFCIDQVEAKRPIEEGFLRRLRLWPSKDAPEQPVDATTLVRAFFTAERARIGGVEGWLRQRYGRPAPPGDVFRLIDYPTFDNGSMEVGLAILLHGGVIHIWSRAVHYHK